MLSSAVNPLLWLLDDKVSLEEDDDVFDDEELELSSLVIPSSSLSLVVFVGNAAAMSEMEGSPGDLCCFIALPAFIPSSSLSLVFCWQPEGSPGDSCIIAAFPAFSSVGTSVVVALLSTVSRRRSCKSALRPSTESPRNWRAFLSSATLIKRITCEHNG